METLTTSNVKTMIDLFKAIDNNDVEGFSGHWASGHHVYFPSGAPPMNRDAHKGMTQGFIASFPDLHHEIIDSVEMGNKVVTRGSFTGTHKGTFNGIPATGKTVRFSWIDISEFDNSGKIINEWVEIDSVGMMMQLGVIPGSPA